MKENEINKRNAEELSKLILEHPNLRVIAWIDTDGVNDDYCNMAGNLYKPCIETITYSDITEMYFSKDGDDYEDCFNYYGCECDDWTDKELEERAKTIPWEDVIAVKVGVC